MTVKVVSSLIMSYLLLTDREDPSPPSMSEALNTYMEQVVLASEGVCSLKMDMARYAAWGALTEAEREIASQHKTYIDYINTRVIPLNTTR